MPLEYHWCHCETVGSVGSSQVCRRCLDNSATPQCRRRRSTKKGQKRGHILTLSCLWQKTHWKHIENTIKGLDLADFESLVCERRWNQDLWAENHSLPGVFEQIAGAPIISSEEVGQNMEGRSPWSPLYDLHEPRLVHIWLPMKAEHQQALTRLVTTASQLRSTYIVTWYLDDFWCLFWSWSIWAIWVHRGGFDVASPSWAKLRSGTTAVDWRCHCHFLKKCQCFIDFIGSLLAKNTII